MGDLRPAVGPHLAANPGGAPELSRGPAAGEQPVDDPARAAAGDAATYVARLAADEATARRIADLLSESLDPTDSACAAFEQPDGRWQVDVHFRARPGQNSLREMIALAGGDRLARAMTVQKVEPRNWVKDSLIGLRAHLQGREPSPVEAAALTEQVESLMRGLKPNYRQVLELRLQGYNVDEIAAATGTGERTVRRVLEQVKQQLQQNERSPSARG